MHYVKFKKCGKLSSPLSHFDYAQCDIKNLAPHIVMVSGVEP